MSNHQSDQGLSILGHSTIRFSGNGRDSLRSSQKSRLARAECELYLRSAASHHSGSAAKARHVGLLCSAMTATAQWMSSPEIGDIGEHLLLDAQRAFGDPNYVVCSRPARCPTGCDRRVHAVSIAYLARADHRRGRPRRVARLAGAGPLEELGKRRVRARQELGDGDIFIEVRPVQGAPTCPDFVVGASVWCRALQ